MRRLLLAILVAAAPAAFARTLTVEGVVDLPPAAAWKAFTTKEALQSWMAAHVEVDLRVGGFIKANYAKDGAIGDAKTITNTILAYDPEHMIAIKATGLPEGFPWPEAMSHVWTVVYFEPAEGGRTRVRAVGLGYPDNEEGEKLRAFFEQGNKVTIEKMAAYAAGLAKK